MADIQSAYSNYVRYILYSEQVNPIEIQEPIGWREDEMELVRHKDYHGIFFSFTGSLKFVGDAKDYILNVYSTLGLNANLILVKQRLREIDGEIKFVTQYGIYADFKSMVVDETNVSLNFNSYDIEEILKSHEDDDFELDRIVDIDNNIIDDLEIQTTTLEGRGLSQSNEHVNYPGSGTGSNANFIPSDEDYALYGHISGFTPLTRLVSESGDSRNSSVDDYKCSDIEHMTASNMFFTAVDDTQQQLTSKVKLTFRIEWQTYNPFDRVDLMVGKFKWNQTTDEYDLIEDVYRNFRENLSDDINKFIDVSPEELYVTCEWDEALALRIHTEGNEEGFFMVTGLSINIAENSFFEPTQDAKFLFTYDVGYRLMYIMTGNHDSFYSKYFGRKELGYTEDGEGALIGNTSGLWVRGFNTDSEKYKSLTINFKNWYESAKAVFNVGLGIQKVGGKERVRVEELKYFYQNETAIRLPYQITNVTRKIDASVFFSGLDMGYKQGGDYSNDMGLDEPNTQSNWTTPIHKSDVKYSQISEIRADDYGMEETRRKPQLYYPDEDTQRDEANWWLDMVRDETTGAFGQAHYWDRLESGFIPYNVFDIDTFYGMIFTPQQMLFRHGWVIRAGLEKYQTDYIMYGSSKANNKLVMKFPNEPEYIQNANLQVSALDRSRISEWTIEFDHPVDDELMDLVLGTTDKEIGGKVEPVPNFYFKVEFMNEDGNYENGYLQSLKPKGKGRWIMRLANEELLSDGTVEKVITSFSADFATDSCGSGEVDYPNTLYFYADEDVFYPTIGDTVFTDIDCYDVFVDGNCKMSNGSGLQTNSDGVSIIFTCG